MRNETISISSTTFKRITKSAAKKLVGEQVIYLLPVNLRFDNAFMPPCPISPEHLDIIDETKEEFFDRIINAYEYYNCNNEVGNYCKFFIEV